MLIKVPIYLEIDSIDPNAISFLVDKLNKDFTRILRKEKLAKIQKITISNDTKIDIEVDMKLVHKERAFEFLRTSK